MLQPPPHIHRTLSEPAIRCFQRAESVPPPDTNTFHLKPERPAIKRSASTFSLSTDVHTGRASAKETQDDLSLHMPTSSPTQMDSSDWSSSRPKRSSAIARPGPLLRRTSSVVFAPEGHHRHHDHHQPGASQSYCPPPSSDDLSSSSYSHHPHPHEDSTDASVPRKHHHHHAPVTDGEHSPGSDARSALQRKRQRMHQRACERHFDGSGADPHLSMHHNYSLNLQIPTSNPFDPSASTSDGEPTSACSSTGGLSELLKAAKTSSPSPKEKEQKGGSLHRHYDHHHSRPAPSASQSSLEFDDTDSDVAREAQSRGGDLTYSSIASSPPEEEDTEMTRPTSLDKPTGPQLVKPTIITTSSEGGQPAGTAAAKGAALRYSGPEAESECARLLLNLSGVS